MPRRYLQGTLDFACGIYAVINALACARGLDLVGARRIFQETGIALAEKPELWRSFMRNETDQYWLVRYMLRRWCRADPWKLCLRQPFSDCLLQAEETADLAGAEMFLPEAEEESGPPLLDRARREAALVWRQLEKWLSPGGRDWPGRTALFRFHRFLRHDVRPPAQDSHPLRRRAGGSKVPGKLRGTPPCISHWTSARGMADGLLYLHDASSEANALLRLEPADLLPEDGSRGMVRIVPESLVLLEPE
ncbi:MAG: hypothetical protein LBD42_06265 [Desulfovibrio sp.]|nr:hypothetical protein [Desulfovibrio sp.]